MSKSKYWCFTENNEAEQFYDDLHEVFAAAEGKIKYICGQLEMASTGQMHFQGYVQLDTSRELSFLKNWVSPTAHFEKQRGTNKQAREYCMKEDTQLRAFIDYGTFFVGRSGRGARNDIHQLRDLIISGATQRELITNDEVVATYSKHLRFHDRVRSLFPPKREDMSNFKVSLYFGEPGTGKTKKAKEFDDLYTVPISNGTFWLDGYDGHKVALLDDFAGKMSKVSLVNTLQLLDRYVQRAPVKGTHTYWMPDHIIITTNIHPRAWYEWGKREMSWRALKRRIHEVLVFEHGDVTNVDVEDFLEDSDLWPEDRTQQYIPA